MAPPLYPVTRFWRTAADNAAHARARAGTGEGVIPTKRKPRTAATGGAQQKDHAVKNTYTDSVGAASAPICVLPIAGDKARALFALATVRGLDASARAVGAVLIDCFNAKTGLCFPGAEYIAGCAGVSRASVFRALNQLEGAGMIKRHRRDGSTRYEVLWSAFTRLGDSAREAGKRQAEAARTRRAAEVGHSPRNDAHDPAGSRTGETPTVSPVTPKPWNLEPRNLPTSSATVERPRHAAEDWRNLTREELDALDVVHDILADYGHERGLTVGGILKCGDELNRFVSDGQIIGRLIRKGYLHRDSGGYVTAPDAERIAA